jgi:hypothetical protein
MDVRVKRLDDTEVVKECQTMAVSVGVSDVAKWLGMEGSNLRFLIQRQASYHWTNPQQRGRLAADFPGTAGAVR